jgi:hypothetical protein
MILPKYAIFSYWEIWTKGSRIILKPTTESGSPLHFIVCPLTVQDKAACNGIICTWSPNPSKKKQSSLVLSVRFPQLNSHWKKNPKGCQHTWTDSSHLLLSLLWLQRQSFTNYFLFCRQNALCSRCLLALHAGWVPQNHQLFPLKFPVGSFPYTRGI